MTNSGLLRKLVRSMLNEIDIEDVEGICMTRGSTHVMNTCYIGGDKFHLKTPDEHAEFKSTTNPSLQSLVEYLAYRIFDLYPDVTIPGRIELVYNRGSKVVSLATKTVPGKHGHSLSLEDLGEGLSALALVGSNESRDGCEKSREKSRDELVILDLFHFYLLSLLNHHHSTIF
jgi:hypothetical protein